MFWLIKTFWKHCHFSVFQHFPLCLCLMPMSIWFCSSTVTPPKLCSWYLRVPYLWIFSLLSKISGGSGGASYLEVTVEIMVRDRRHPNKCIYYPKKLQMCPFIQDLKPSCSETKVTTITQIIAFITSKSYKCVSIHPRFKTVLLCDKSDPPCHARLAEVP